VREITLELRVQRSAAGWRGRITVPTAAGSITLATEVPVGAIVALRQALGPRGAVDQPEETAGFLPLLGVVATIYKLARQYGPTVIKLFRRYGPKIVGVIRREGLPGILRLVRGGAQGLVQSAIRRAISRPEVPPALAAVLSGAYTATQSIAALPGVESGVRESAELAGRIIDAGVAARMGDPHARAWLERCSRDGRCTPAARLAQELVR